MEYAKPIDGDHLSVLVEQLPTHSDKRCRCARSFGIRQCDDLVRARHLSEAPLVGYGGCKNSKDLGAQLRE